MPAPSLFLHRSRHRSRQRGRIAAAALVAGLPFLASAADAAILLPPAPAPGPHVADINDQFASHAALLDLGSTFLQRLGRQATWGIGAAANQNPEGGGAPAAAAPPLWRGWAEGYGISSRTDPQGSFTGDRRKTFGGVAGLALTPLPGLSIGITVDRSDTRIQMPAALQNGALDLTQFGVNFAYAIGPWTLSAVGVHGWAGIDSQRGTPLGTAKAGYDGRVDGALGELSYYWGIGQSRVVPKLGVEYVRATTDSFQETGGLAPVSAAAATGERTRVLLGAEVGHYWIAERRVFDIWAYGKFVDNVAQNMSPITVSANGQAVTVAGIIESRLGADAGAGLSVGVTQNVRLYGNYDGKYRQNFVSHQGTIGVEVRW